jgi:hypothetical protein
MTGGLPRPGPLPPTYCRHGFVASQRWLGHDAVTVRSAVMDVATLVIAVFGAVLGTASLVWQFASHVLTGGRISVELRVGVMRDSGSDLITGMPTDLAGGAELWRRVAEQGYTRPVITVRVRATGRMPVTVERWYLVCSPARTASLFKPRRRRRYITELTTIVSIGPELPHRLDAGGSEMWSMPALDVLSFAETSKKVFKLSAVYVTAKVELGDGRIHWTSLDEAIRI